MSIIVQRTGALGVLWSLGILALATFLITIAGSIRANAPGPGVPARVCIVDLERVFNSSPKLASMDAEIQVREDEIVALAKAGKAELERLKGELELVKPGSSEHQKIRRDLATKQEDLRFQSEQWEREMQTRVIGAKEQLLKEIEVVVIQVCETDGFDIVLQKEFKIPKTPVSWTTAFYTRPEFDITERVISALK